MTSGQPRGVYGAQIGPGSSVASERIHFRGAVLDRPLRLLVSPGEKDLQSHIFWYARELGTSSVKERKAREGRNPRTGQKMKIVAQKVSAFSAGNALKEVVSADHGATKTGDRSHSSRSPDAPWMTLRSWPLASSLTTPPW